MEVAAKEIERLGGSAELVDIGKQKVTVNVLLVMHNRNLLLR